MERQGVLERSVHSWQDALRQGDEEAFQTLVKPYMKTLLVAAHHDLSFYVRQGFIHGDDFTAEEIAGEALINAWEHRLKCPDRMSLRGWLLGTQYRVLRGLVEQQHDYREERTVSLDEPLPIDRDGYDVREWFWDWYQPENAVTWEDMVPGSEPIELDEDLLEATNEIMAEADAPQRDVLLMHDQFEMTLQEVAFTMNRDVSEISALLEQARDSFHKRLPPEHEVEEMSYPAPPRGCDQ